MNVTIVARFGPLLLVLCGSAVAAESRSGSSSDRFAVTIDAFLNAHWQFHGVTPAPPADDATFLRRITLDLCGRIPTAAELDRFRADDGQDKRQRLIERLIQSPEFELHFGNVLDDVIQGRYAGRDEFVDYLRRRLREGVTWKNLFRELMLGPWEDESTKAANQFLDRRARDLDSLTTDTARTFFGVDISCAKCHDHPLVPDWTQEHFYGMAAFLNRTTGGKGKVGEKRKGEIKFLGSDGLEKTAKMMFLSGQVIDESTTQVDQSQQKSQPYSRREQLVRVALSERSFFSRAIVNRLWAYFLGRGLLDPVDQMHSANEPAVPGLVSQLADDFADAGYDLRSLIVGLVSSRAYRLSSRWEQNSSLPDEKMFAVSRLRPLSRQQLAFSVLLATGNESLGAAEIPLRVERLLGVSGLARMQQYLNIERRATPLGDALDPPQRPFQSSAGEALFMSNNPAMQSLVKHSSGNLVAQLSELDSTSQVVTSAMRTVLTRAPSADEMQQYSVWFDRQSQGDRVQTCEQLVWALVTSAEFRFNH